MGLKEQVRSVAGETVKVRLTVPVNPFNGATVMVEDPELLWAIATMVGLAWTMKSSTVTLTVAEWDREPLVPVTVTV